VNDLSVWFVAGALVVLVAVVGVVAWIDARAERKRP